jgi:hypothetical protein
MFGNFGGYYSRSRAEAWEGSLDCTENKLLTLRASLRRGSCPLAGRVLPTKWVGNPSCILELTVDCCILKPGASLAQPTESFLMGHGYD